MRYPNHVPKLTRLTIDSDVMGGKPCIRGMRVTVRMIVEALSAGRAIEQLLADFPYLEAPDVREALAFAARRAQGHGDPHCQLMRLPIDRNLTPRWVLFLHAANDEVHWSSNGRISAEDGENCDLCPPT